MAARTDNDEQNGTPPPPDPPTTDAAPPSDPDPAPDPAPEPVVARRPRIRGRIVAAVSVFGELLITAGVVMGLFVVYSLWWTNVLADREAAKQGDDVRHGWARGATGDSPRTFDSEDGIGFLHVPAMGSREVLVKKGTSASSLNNGIAGYYTDPVKSALPWDKKGNFTLAAHRDGHGARFHNIHKLKDGDPVVFETRDTWYVYKVFKELPKTSKYNVDVLQPVPKESGKTKPGRYLTLTTCTPVYTSDYRYIVWAELVRTEKVDKERALPPELR
ncbi:class E sortase [Streptomyces sp. NPDC088116]|uniref:class E sortase n=1 Tax=Streptomyces sp. NPDC088116 TaxID=3365825 RepID=UPI00381B4073